MRISQKRGGITRHEPEGAFESMMLIAQMNEKHFCDDAALRCYKEALEIAPDETAKKQCKAKIKQLEDFKKKGI